jgi:hypothetical protein
LFVSYPEVKGFETPDLRLKWKLFDALHPEFEKPAIKVSRDRFARPPAYRETRCAIRPLLRWR